MQKLQSKKQVEEDVRSISYGRDHNCKGLLGKASSESRGNMSTVPKLVSNDHTGVVNCEGRMK